jgi:hypothetical protein
MPSRKENTIIGTAFAVSVIGSLLSIPGLGHYSYLGFLSYIGIWTIYGCAVYWSFDIRKGLSSNLFRNQALGMGLVSISMGSITFLLLGTISLPSNVAIIWILSAFLVIVYWIDISIRAAQRVDPLLRDPLHWRQVRWIMWAFFAPAIVWVIAVVAQDTQLANYLVFFTIWPVLAALVSGIIYIPVSIIKSSDRSLKAHFKWFALFLASFVFIISPTITIPFNPLTGFLLGIGFLLGSYCLYRSARSLAPLERLSPVAEKSASV